VAIGGNTIVAGGPQENGQIGAVYVFVEPAGGWTNMTETAKLTASDEIPGNLLGTSVSIAGNTIVAGAFQNNTVGIVYPVGPGAAYVYEEPAGGWTSMTETAKLTASDGQSGDDLGYNVVTLGDTIAAAAPNATVGGNSHAGAIYVYQRRGPTWTSGTETAKLTASDAGFGTALGFSMDISGTTIAAEGAGWDYIFTKPAGGWVSGTQTAELKDPKAVFVVGVAIFQGYVVAGEPGPHPAESHGALYVEPSTGWANEGPTTYLRQPADSVGEFGRAVAMRGNTIVIASPSFNGGQSIVYVYSPN
jgi:FG-GAP repeat